MAEGVSELFIAQDKYCSYSRELASTVQQEPIKANSLY